MNFSKLVIIFTIFTLAAASETTMTPNLRSSSSQMSTTTTTTTTTALPTTTTTTTTALPTTTRPRLMMDDELPATTTLPTTTRPRPMMDDELPATTTAELTGCAAFDAGQGQSYIMVMGRGNAMANMAFFRSLDCDWDAYLRYSWIIGGVCIGIFVIVVIVMCVYFCNKSRSMQRQFSRF